jgi:branched-chain amino acid transport system ATP-binding protein
MSHLEVNKLTKAFGGILALNSLSLAVEPGERRAIIGPNGAGKSTFFNVISGELPPTSGRVFLDGRDITSLPTFRRAQMGLGHTFQRNNLFPGLTALQNVRLAVQGRLALNRHLFRPVASFAAAQEQSEAALADVGLLPLADRPVAELAYGQQRALEIALALAASPTVLLLDEPTAGMSPGETAEIARLIQALPRSLTMLIVEHDMDVIFSLADAITVLHYGQVIASGSPDAVRNDARVQEIYLGSLAGEMTG